MQGRRCAARRRPYLQGRDQRLHRPRRRRLRHVARRQAAPARQRLAAARQSRSWSTCGNWGRCGRPDRRRIVFRVRNGACRTASAIGWLVARSTESPALPWRCSGPSRRAADPTAGRRSARPSRQGRDGAGEPRSRDERGIAVARRLVRDVTPEGVCACLRVTTSRAARAAHTAIDPALPAPA